MPVVRETLADLDTPLSLFRRLDDGRSSFLFESIEGAEKWARYSFIGTGARAVFRACGSEVEWIEGGHTQHIRAQGDPLEILRDKLSALRAVTPEGVDLPRFLGGAVGLIGYDWVRFVERIPDENPDETGMPDLWFVLPETVVVYDNLRHSAIIVRHVEVREGDDPARAATARRRGRSLEDVVRRLRKAAARGARTAAAARSHGRPPQRDARAATTRW